MKFVPHRKHVYGSSGPATGVAFFYSFTFYLRHVVLTALSDTSVSLAVTRPHCRRCSWAAITDIVSGRSGVVYNAGRSLRAAVYAIYHGPLIAFRNQQGPETFISFSLFLPLLIDQPFCIGQPTASFSSMPAVKCYRVTLLWPA
jgi:hypothetical protein